jgi:hypothetical protein
LTRANVRSEATLLTSAGSAWPGSCPQHNANAACLSAAVRVHSTDGKEPWRYSDRGEFKSRFRLVSMCMVQTRKIIPASIEIASGHTTSGCRTNEVVSPATEQNRSAPIAFVKPASLRNTRCPTAQAASRAATATNPRMRGAIMLVSTDQTATRHATVLNARGVVRSLTLQRRAVNRPSREAKQARPLASTHPDISCHG